MKQVITGSRTPMAAICINKSRLKTYHKEKTPTFYLEKGQEFQIELFNPTSDTILAKVELNGNKISQGGLVLRPGEHVFLERYIDVPKKFKFDTYEVANTTEVRKAIEDNGDFKVEFYKESRLNYLYGGSITLATPPTYTDYNGTGNPYYGTLIGNYNLNNRINSSSDYIQSYFSTLDLNMEDKACATGILNTTSSNTRSPKTIETGRVEAGSDSNQKLESVDKSFDFWPFHTIEYKLLPISQKINSIDDINIKRYCHNCGAKQKKEFKFCPICGTKA